MDMKELTKLANSQLRLEAKVQKAEDALKKAKEDLAVVAEVDLPEAMDAADVEEFTMRDGNVVSIKTNYAANISTDREKDALRWLIKHKFGSLIRRDLAVQLEKGQNKQAKDIFRFIKKTVPGSRPQDRAWVHGNTLKAFVREQMEAGALDEPTMKLFGVHKLVRAKIKPAR